MSYATVSGEVEFVKEYDDFLVLVVSNDAFVVPTVDGENIPYVGEGDWVDLNVGEQDETGKFWFASLA